MEPGSGESPTPSKTKGAAAVACSDLLGQCVCLFPLLSGRVERGFMVWPIVQSRRVKICAGGPDERVNFTVELHLGELLGISQWAKKLSLEHRLKVDGPFKAVLEGHNEHVSADLFETLDAVNWMLHGFNLAQRSDRCRATAFLL